LVPIGPLYEVSTVYKSAMRCHHDVQFSQVIPLQYHNFSASYFDCITAFVPSLARVKNSVTVRIERFLSQPLTNNHCHFLIIVPYSCYSFSQNVCCTRIQYAHKKSHVHIPFIYRFRQQGDLMHF
jgi:hypothetical protein